jgi:hypothetical protein
MVTSLSVRGSFFCSFFCSFLSDEEDFEPELPFPESLYFVISWILPKAKVTIPLASLAAL